MLCWLNSSIQHYKLDTPLSFVSIEPEAFVTVMGNGPIIHIVSKKVPFTQIRKGRLWERWGNKRFWVIKRKTARWISFQVHPRRQKNNNIVLLALLTLNLFRWLSGTVSLSGQLQQLPMASSEDHVSTAQKIIWRKLYQDTKLQNRKRLESTTHTQAWYFDAENKAQWC